MKFFNFFLLFLLGFSSLSVITSRNPIHSVLSLIIVFLLSAVLLFCLKVEFLALSFIIIYVGAIAILFLFIIMMLDIKNNDTSFVLLDYSLLGYFLSFVFLLEIFFPVIKFNEQPFILFLTQYTWVRWSSELDTISNVQAIGQLLYTFYFLFLLLAGFILLVSILGALMLTINMSSNLKKDKILPLTLKKALNKSQKEE